jgi:hypothetical protein
MEFLKNVLYVASFHVLELFFYGFGRTGVRDHGGLSEEAGGRRSESR